MTEQDIDRLLRIEQAARELLSFLFSHSCDFWPGPMAAPDLPTALKGLEVQLAKLDDACSRLSVEYVPRKPQ